MGGDRLSTNRPAYARAYRDENRRRILRYLLEHPCEICGEADPLVLQFDHLDRAAKSRNIANMVLQVSWPTVAAEIAKCRVLCANCHARHTAVQLGYRLVEILEELRAGAELGGQDGC